MADVKINYTELINKGAKQTDAAKVAAVKSILTNLRTYIMTAVNA
jgi:hypothetical protein